MKGGYQIIDLGGVALSSTIASLPDKIANANGKPIILTNFKISTTAYKDMYMCNYIKSGTSYIISLVLSNTVYQITITSAGAITLKSGNVTVA